MEQLIKNLIDHLTDKRLLEYENIERYKQDDSKDLILITSGKLIELDSLIKHLNEMLIFYSYIQPMK
jgi:hypothetical protein